MIATALLLAQQFLPSLVGSLMGDKAEAVAESVVSMAQGVTGTASPDDAMKALAANPEMALRYKEKLIDFQTVELQEETKRLQSVNATMQAEYNVNDWFVRRWRPFFGYCVAISWFIQMTLFSIALAYTIIKNPAGLSVVITALGQVVIALAGLWSLALAVLGISVHSRSKDKQTAAGHPPAPGLLATIFNSKKDDQQ